MPLHSAMRDCTGWKPSTSLPMPSVVVTICPAMESSGRRQALTEQWSISPDAFFCESMTVHAPQPPCPQEIVVPVRPMAFSRRSVGAARG